MRGIELVDEQNGEDAIPYLKRELLEHGRSDETYLYLAKAYNQTEEYSDAIEAANRALLYLDKKDIEYLSDRCPCKP